VAWRYDSDAVAARATARYTARSLVS